MTAWLLMRQGAKLFRFLRMEASSDGSLVVIVDRTPRTPGRDMTLGSSGFVADEARPEPKPSAKFTIHASGEIHRYQGGERRSTTHIEPIYALPATRPVGLISIPRVDLLDAFEGGQREGDVLGELEVPDDVDGRISFALEMAPLNSQAAPFGIAFNYEAYSAIVRVVPTPLALPSEVAEHFIYASPPGSVEGRLVQPAEAELGFYKVALGGTPPIFRGAGGDYIVLAAVLMCIAPRLVVEFDRRDLSIEQIPFGTGAPPTHKVRFWIRDKGGRNKSEDLRKHIVSVALDAER